MYLAASTSQDGTATKPVDPGVWCRDDLVSLIIEALTSDAYSGVYNGTAPNPVRMSELCSQLGDTPFPPFSDTLTDTHTHVCTRTHAHILCGASTGMI